MLSVSKTKVNKEYIYVKKHTVNVYSLEEVIFKFKKSNDKVEEVANFYLEKIDFEKLRFVMKMLANSDGKTKLNINQVRDYITQLVTEAVDNFIKNPTDASYVSESIIVAVTSYQSKHQLIICPRFDFTK